MAKQKPRRLTESLVRRVGRPRGARSKDYPQSIAVKSRCPKCGSTSRTRYHDPYVMNMSGLKDGRRYTKVIRRKTACKACGQHRVDLTYEFPIEEPGSESTNGAS